MPTLRLVRADEPIEACESENLRLMLARLTLGTHDRTRGPLVLRPSEEQALYDALSHRTFSSDQLEAVEAAIRVIDPNELDSDWDSFRLASFVQASKRLVDHQEWIDRHIRRLHVAMRVQGPQARFRLVLCRAVLVIFLTIDFLPSQPEELLRLAG